MLLEPVVPNVFSRMHGISDGWRFIHEDFVSNVKMNVVRDAADAAALVAPNVLNDTLAAGGSLSM